MTTTALNNLWTYLQGLTLAKSDREWLASKLLEPTEKQEETEPTTTAYKVKSLSPQIEKWSGCVSFTKEELEDDPRIKAIISR
ncbi:MAG: hypothetical protein IKI16_06845 [Prevotella sp.]|jgi:hypothetical protein|nr:hypothetical protein [Prevotella sp.]